MRNNLPFLLSDLKEEKLYSQSVGYHISMFSVRNANHCALGPHPKNEERYLATYEFILNSQQNPAS